MSDEPTAARIVAAALNRAGVESDDGTPWTEEKVAAIYKGMPEGVFDLLEDANEMLRRKARQ
jgi:hypothetical protein